MRIDQTKLAEWESPTSANFVFGDIKICKIKSLIHFLHGRESEYVNVFVRGAEADEELFFMP